jgi:hypothetical protein
LQAELLLWEDCLDLLGDEEESEDEWLDFDAREGEGQKEGEMGKKKKDHRTEAALCLLRGRAFEFKENRERATYWYILFNIYTFIFILCYAIFIFISFRFILFNSYLFLYFLYQVCESTKT